MEGVEFVIQLAMLCSLSFAIDPIYYCSQDIMYIFELHIDYFSRFDSGIILEWRGNVKRINDYL